MIRKNSVIIAIFAIIIMLFSTSAVAVGSPTATVSSVTSESGSNIKLTVTLSDCRMLKSMMIKDIAYDGSILELVSGKWMLDDMAISSSYKSGAASMALEANTDINGKVFEIAFKVCDGVESGKSDVSFTLYANYAETGSADIKTSIAVVPGVVTVGTDKCKHADTEVRNAKTPTCTEQGYTGDTYCVSCGDMLESGRAINVLGHTGGVATCCNKAVCKHCGNEYGKLEPNKHAGGTEYRNAITATEDKAGYSGDKYCLGCGELLEKGHTTDKLDHVHLMTHHDAVAADCTNGGTVEYWLCSECGKSFADKNGTTDLVSISTDKDPSKHIGETEIRGERESTDTTEGYTGDTYCKSCGELIMIGEIIPKLTNGVNTLTDSTGVKVSQSGSFVSGTEIKVKDITSELKDTLDAAAMKNMEDGLTVVGKNAEILSAFDISLYLDDVEVQPDGKVKVSMPLPNSVDDYTDISIVIISDDGSVTKLTSEITSDKMIEFEVDRLSIYAIAGIPANSQPNVLYVIIPIVLLLAVAFAIIVVIITKKKKRR